MVLQTQIEICDRYYTAFLEAAQAGNRSGAMLYFNRMADMINNVDRAYPHLYLLEERYEYAYSVLNSLQ